MSLMQFSMVNTLQLLSLFFNFHHKYFFNYLTKFLLHLKTIDFEMTLKIYHFYSSRFQKKLLRYEQKQHHEHQRLACKYLVFLITFRLKSFKLKSKKNYYILNLYKEVVQS